MSISIKALGIDRLAIDERLTLIEEIWDSIGAEDAQVPLTVAQRDELDRRVADHEANPSDVVAWEEVRDSVERRLPK